MGAITVWIIWAIMKISPIAASPHRTRPMIKKAFAFFCSLAVSSVG